MMTKILSAAAAASLAVAPVAAQAAAAPIERSSATTEQSNELGSMGTPLLILLAVAAAVGIYFLIDDGNDDPISA